MTTEEECQHEDDTCSALARKRRRQIRKKQREAQGNYDEPMPEESNKRKRAKEENETTKESSKEQTTSKPKPKPKPSITGIKKQARYEPGVPMTKDELVAWRKEARRVRNRLSAAESRSKTRARIDELEDQMGHLQNKYDVAMERILELEAVNANLRNSCQLTSEVFINEGLVSPCNSPRHGISRSSTPPPITLSDHHEGNSCSMDVNEKYQHIIKPISRLQA